MQKKVDLNSDVGESFGIYKIGSDEEVIPLISSANIACGFHAGDPSVMKRTLDLAGKNGVGPGAHPGLPDLMGFGRRKMDVSLEEIRDYVIYQVGALQAVACSQGFKLRHVKPHGALYNMAVANADIWEVFAQVLSLLDKDLILVALAGPNREALKEMAAKYSIRIAFEFFADRAYNPDGSLVSRSTPGAVLKDDGEVADRIVKLVHEGEATALDGTKIALKAETICVHGDNPHALSLVRRIREALTSSGIEVCPMGAFL
ncbi:MAG TPA: LamB/YcsF family protein [Deltaproteobacteria bacterium]|nr:LamB/YcsF family protein [Deltaproteobacteria bacterium]